MRNMLLLFLACFQFEFISALNPRKVLDKYIILGKLKKPSWTRWDKLDDNYFIDGGDVTKGCRLLSLVFHPDKNPPDESKKWNLYITGINNACELIRNTPETFKAAAGMERHLEKIDKDLNNDIAFSRKEAETVKEAQRKVEEAVRKAAEEKARQEAQRKAEEAKRKAAEEKARQEAQRKVEEAAHQAEEAMRKAAEEEAARKTAPPPAPEMQEVLDELLPGKLEATKIFYPPAKALNLSSLNLKVIPPRFFTKLFTVYPQLEMLFLNNNQLTTLPSEIGNLINLRNLYLHNNQLKMLPSEIGNLINLQGLYLDNNQLTLIPVDKIAALPKLRVLMLANNPLQKKVKKNLKKLLKGRSVAYNL